MAWGEDCGHTKLENDFIGQAVAAICFPTKCTIKNALGLPPAPQINSPPSPLSSESESESHAILEQLKIAPGPLPECCSGQTPRYTQESWKSKWTAKAYRSQHSAETGHAPPTRHCGVGLSVCPLFQDQKGCHTVDGRQEPRGQVRLLLYTLWGLYTCCTTYLLSYYRAWRSKQYYLLYALTQPMLLIAYLLCWLRWWRVYDVMPRLSVRYAYEGLMHHLDSWAGWLMWHITRYPSILRGSIVF